MTRRAAVEPSIGHLKSDHRLGRNYLAGKDGDSLNAVLSAAGMNFGKLLKHAAVFLSLLSLCRKIFKSGENNGLLCRNILICLEV